MRELEYLDKFYIGGNGVFVISLSENNLPVIRKEIKEKLLGKQVILDKITFKVIGVEFRAFGDYCPHSTVGLLVRE